MEIMGCLASVFIGVSLGLIGAGGSILTVPVMVYLFHVPVMTATSYSLFIVGITSLLGAFRQYRQHQVNAKVAVFFCLISLTIVSVIRNSVLPQIPAQWFHLYGVPVTLSLVSMVLFAVLMVVAAFSMIRRKQPAEVQPPSNRTSGLLLCALLVGLVTGFLGVGGGFILIPSLVLLLHLPMKQAIGTSLLIIALNSLAGFATDLRHLEIDWMQLGLVTLFAIGGIFLGMAAGTKVSAQRLKLSFGWFVMVLGILILAKELAAFVTKIQAGLPMVSQLKN